MRRQYLFRLPGAKAFLLAAVREGNRFFIVTTKLNANVAPAHDRIQLVLGSGKSRILLGPSFATLADRNQTALLSRPST